MGSCGGSCACRTGPSTATSHHLIVRSATAQTLAIVAEVAGTMGASVTRDGRLCHLEGRALAPLVLAIDAALSATESAEARAVFFPGDISGSDVLDRVMGALSVAELAARERHRDLVELADAPERFYARFQPIVDLATRGTVAHEALLRARDVGGGEIGAQRLFTAAAAGGWINVLDRIGRETAIQDASGWLGDGQLFVNFVPTSIYRPEVCLATTLAAARRHEVSLSQLTFEVVETHRTDDIRQLVAVVEYYRRRGARVALDDVGSGYASLSLVAQIRPDVVKIDMDLVQRLPDPTSVAIVTAIVELSHGIGATVIAEGIETEAQAAISRELGADLGQGWLFGRPALAGDLAARRDPERDGAAVLEPPSSASAR